MIEYHFDGSGTGYAFAVVENGESAYFEAKMSPPEATVNENEYNGLLLCLDYIAKNKYLMEDREINIWGDSQLVINQVNCKWRAKNERMKKLRNDAFTKIGLIRGECKDIKIKWFAGNKNLADVPSRKFQ